MRRLAALVLTPVLLLAVGGCQGAGSGSAPQDNSPGGSVNKQFDDVEKTLDNIESEVNAG